MPIRPHGAAQAPPGGERGVLFESRTRSLLGGDLFPQGGAEHQPVTKQDNLGPSREMQAAFDYYPHTRTRAAADELV